MSSRFCSISIALEFTRMTAKPAIVKLFLLDQNDDAELDRKKVAAMYAMVLTSPAPYYPAAMIAQTWSSIRSITFP